MLSPSLFPFFFLSKNKQLKWSYGKYIEGHDTPDLRELKKPLKMCVNIYLTLENGYSWSNKCSRGRMGKLSNSCSHNLTNKVQSETCAQCKSCKLNVFFLTLLFNQF